MRRLVVLVPLLLAVGAGATDAVPADGQTLSAPNPLELGTAMALAAPGRTPVVAKLSIRSFASWGGQYVTTTGETVTIQVSDSYPQDPARAQQWANFLGSLVHGTEISRLTLILAPLREVQRECGAQAYACYSPESQTMVAPGEAPDSTTSAESVVAHEYGHHLAANRLNPPWDAVEYGTKRWASYEQICKETESGHFFPGAEDRRYPLNPGEGFAEAFRVLNERRLGLAEGSWSIVSQAFYPDTASLAALEQDVTAPWTANTVTTTAGRFDRRGRTTRTSTLATALDGNIAVTLRAPATLRARLVLMSGTTRLGSVTVGGSGKMVRAVACGSRSVTAKVVRVVGFGRYSLTLSRP